VDGPTLEFKHGAANSSQQIETRAADAYPQARHYCMLIQPCCTGMMRVHATVYRTRDKGVRLPRPQQGVSGHLVLLPWKDGSRTSLRAKLTDERSQASSLLPDLHDALVERISANGIKISGTEVIARRTTNKSSADYFRQTWWCLVHTIYIAEFLDVVQLDDEFKPILPT